MYFAYKGTTFLSNMQFFYEKYAFFTKIFAQCMRATPFHLSKQQYLRTPPCKKMCCSHTFFSNSPEATFAKCSKYALFLYKNTFFSKNICVFAFFVVPLQPISTWCHRLSVRTRDFHSLKRGSIPRGTTDNNKL